MNAVYVVQCNDKPAQNEEEVNEKACIDYKEVVVKTDSLNALWWWAITRTAKMPLNPSSCSTLSFMRLIGAPGSGCNGFQAQGGCQV
jgi:hypothetical protein